MGQNKDDSEPKLLTSKELKKLVAQDNTEKPSLFVVVTLEIFEWCFWGAVVYIVYVFAHPVLSPVIKMFQKSLHQVFG